MTGLFHRMDDALDFDPVPVIGSGQQLSQASAWRVSRQLALAHNVDPSQMTMGA